MISLLKKQTGKKAIVSRKQSARAERARSILGLTAIKISWIASPVEKSTGDAIFQNWRAAGETSRLFRDPLPFCFSRLCAPTLSVSSGLLRIK